jgi:hypothetical protein
VNYSHDRVNRKSPFEGTREEGWSGERKGRGEPFKRPERKVGPKLCLILGHNFMMWFVL